MTSGTPQRLVKRLQKIRALLLDVEGVLVGDSVLASMDGSETSAFSVRDTDAIRQAIDAGVRVGILTRSRSPVVAERARELGIIDVLQDSFNKLESYEAFRVQYGYEDEEIAYIGDDILDIPVLKRAGFSAAPPVAHPHAKITVDYVTTLPGGDGAVSEIIGMLIRVRSGK